MARHDNLFERNGIWIFKKEVNGRTYKRSTRCRDYRLARRRARDFENAIFQGAFGWANSSPTFGEWVSTYVERYTPRKRTRVRDRQILEHVLPRWGTRPLDAIMSSDCSAYVHRRSAEGAAAGTVNRERGLLCAIFNRAIDEGLLTANPFRSVRRLRTEPRERVLGWEEQPRLAAELNPEYRRLVTVFLGTGLRLNEAMSLRPLDVGPTLIRVRSETAKGAKRRDVPVLPDVRHAVEEQIVERRRGAGDRLWAQTPWAVLKALQGAAARAGVPPLCVHDLRRTFATRAAMEGMPMAQLAAILGHSSLETTKRYYVFAQTADLIRGMAAVSRRWRRRAGPQAGPLREEGRITQQIQG